MRNTDDGGNTLDTMWFSSRALARSCPNGFSITTRLHRPGCCSARPCERSWSTTVWNSPGEIGERFVVADLAGYEPNAFGELLPDLFAERCARVLPHGVVDHLCEVVVMPSTACVSDQGETGRQQPPVCQVVDRRHQLLGRQITRDAEDHQDARSGDPRQSAVVRIAEEVGVAFSHQLTS